LPYALDRAILLPGEGLKSDVLRRQSAMMGGGGAPPGPAIAAAVAKEKSHSGKMMGVAKLFTGALSVGPKNKSHKSS